MFKDKTILITGGTGSFGKAFTEKLLCDYDVSKIIIYSRDEFKQDLFKKFLYKNYKDKVNKVRFFIGDVRDRDRLYRASKDVNYIIHAAAMKQVPACEYNPFEAIKTNIYGAQNIIDAAIDNGVEKVIALSTDKAVNPINLYGGTKLVSDKLFISANAYSNNGKTTFCVVRYGNVAGSRGSIIPFFKNIIEDGNDVIPITDARMTRFFISLEQGIQAVIKAINESRGGETYISKIPSFKVTDLALAMLPTCKFNFIGIREGEKLHEVMITKDDSRTTYEYKDYYIIYPNFEWWNFDKHFTPGGILIKDGFEYNSANNLEWLDVPSLKDSLIRLNLFKPI